MKTFLEGVLLSGITKLVGGASGLTAGGKGDLTQSWTLWIIHMVDAMDFLLILRLYP